jgi:hypothetical protein
MEQEILSRLPFTYMINQTDRNWLKFVEFFWDGKRTEESYLEAIDKALEEIERFTVDPYELFIDAGVIKD